jgi:hypothetical protein
MPVSKRENFKLGHYRRFFDHRVEICLVSSTTARDPSSRCHLALRILIKVLPQSECYQLGVCSRAQTPPTAHGIRPSVQLESTMQPLSRHRFRNRLPD